MGKNKPAYNAFYFFMVELKNKHGRNYGNLKEAADAAGPLWKNLSKEQRKPYEDMARMSKASQKKQTSLGESVDIIAQQESDRKIREQNAKIDIDNTVGLAVRSGNIAETPFFILHINHFCYCSQEDKYYPAEIALGKFSLQEGIKVENVYHQIIKPGMLPVGYSYEAKKHSDETHQLPPPTGDDEEKNIFQVFQSIMQYIADDCDEASLPAFYVNEKDIPLVEDILDKWCMEFSHQEYFRIYSLQYLLFVLRNSVNKSHNKIWPTVSVSCLELEKDVYDYCKGIACEFHENADIPVYCSRSRVIRMAYIICDNCIGDLGINVILGQHVPLNSKIGIHSRPVSAQSSHKNNSTAASTSLYATPAGSSKPTCMSSRMSVMSEVTVEDNFDISSLKEFDSASQITVEDERGLDFEDQGEWLQPKTKGKHKHSSASSSQYGDTLSSQASNNSEFVPGRRPVTLSAALTSLTIGQSNSRGPVPHLGRGRGRGIAHKPSR